MGNMSIFYDYEHCNIDKVPQFDALYHNLKYAHKMIHSVLGLVLTATSLALASMIIGLDRMEAVPDAKIVDNWIMLF